MSRANLHTNPEERCPLPPWCLGGNGGMDPYSSPYIMPNNSPHSPFPHSLLSTREPRQSLFVSSFPILFSATHSAKAPQRGSATGTGRQALQTLLATQRMREWKRISILYVRRTPPIRDKKEYIRILLYSHYTTITGWGVLLNYTI